MGAEMKKYDLITMGEVMLRLSPERHERIADGNVFEKHAGGAEFNVAAGVAQLGLSTALVTKIPENELGTYIQRRIQFGGVSNEFILYDASPNARLGVYYYEQGASPRKPLAIYDRRETSVNTLKAAELPEQLWTTCRLFHTSGITTALSEDLCRETVSVIRRLKEQGTKISFDVNYRASLWTEEEARKTIEMILPLADILFVSEETGRRMFRKIGDLEDIMKSFADEYGIAVVASTKRTVYSPMRHDFTSVVYERAQNTFYREKPYRDIQVIDRIGSGDAYVAGMLYGILKHGDVRLAMRYGNAMSTIKNTVPGDQASASLLEIEELMRRHESGEAGSELKR